MKIKCTCGNIIRDQTDYLPHKAYIIGDKNYFDFLDEIDDTITASNNSESKEAFCMKIRRAEPSRLGWECNICGRLYLNDTEHNLVEYSPQNGKANRIFDRERVKPKS